MNKPESAALERDAFQAMLELDPKIVQCFVPDNGDDQKEAFLSGTIDNPDHNYPKCQSFDFDQFSQDVKEASDTAKSATRNPKFESAYDDYLQSYLRRGRLIQAAAAIKDSPAAGERHAAEQSFMEVNRQMNGEPDETTFRSLLRENLASIAAKSLTGQAERIRTELFTVTDYEPDSTIAERFKPSLETVTWMSDVVETLYGGMLKHVPDQPSCSGPEIATIFESILREEFAGSADDWEVAVEAAASVRVRASQKQIIVPENSKDRPIEKVKDLVVHEIGVHALRAIMGYQTDLPTLAVGLSGYFDSEEGLGVVMEQARKGEFKEAGVMHYISAGSACFDKKDFRGLYEQRWRMEALAKVEDGQDITEDIIESAKDRAYKGTMRCMRGTDELPWFKDLSYYNGAVSVWKHLEAIRGDDLKFTFVLLGKADASNIAHERLMYETATE